MNADWNGTKNVSLIYYTNHRINRSEKRAKRAKKENRDRKIHKTTKAGAATVTLPTNYTMLSNP